MQDTLLKLWKTNKVFNDNEHIDKWLTITCVHKCKDHFRLPFVKHSGALDEAKELYTFDTDVDFEATKSTIETQLSELFDATSKVAENKGFVRAIVEQK